ncbi:hypothetical protein RM697_00710 [Ichthyenterobacterium sp. W332]|uniref:Adhesin domain-containing protein n=1 Tax=Microcosmobacter mediterraneus TaxID=3075607 RepID=A0ABU2YH88_9FLAO|nr:hypothetical protein [Ichthyenterobacterium sp. W332]MDT0557145.1 hypothetical protein [Ichthyenterobacterium sp. W332]
MKTKLKLILLCIAFTSFAAAQKLSKISKSVNVTKDVAIDLNTSYVQIEIETWDKDIIEVEAYLESNKLSKEELKKALENWDIEVAGSGDYVSINSKGSRNSWNNIAGVYVTDLDYSDVLKDLELRLAEMPEMPEMPELPAFVLPEIAEMPELPALAEMPEFPELPELPKGTYSINFDYDQYKKDGEKYLEKWSKEYEEEGGKELQDKMKDWARRFAESGYHEKMEKWGEEFGQRFEGKWAKEMEEWGEKFAEQWDNENGEKLSKEWAKKMEKWGQEFGKRFDTKWQKDMEKWSKELEQELIDKYGEDYKTDLKIREKRLKEREKRKQELELLLQERKEEQAERRERLDERLAEREAEMAKRQEEIAKRLEHGGERNVKKTIKIKMPKEAKLNLNVRHGELKFSSVIYNLKADVSHSTLLAKSIDGNDTSINASYSSILVNDWKYGTLNLNYVEDALLKSVDALMLNANSSNINIDNLKGNSIIDGSFGELTIHNISDSFNNLNIILENSEALVKLPKTDFNLQYKGNRSRLTHPENVKGKSVESFSSGVLNSNKTIIVNAKFSDVIMQ